MVTDAVRTGAFFPKRPVEDQPEWHAAARLLEKGEYAQLANLLQKVKTVAEQSGDMALANLLGATQQICLACGQNKVAKKSYKQAYEEAVDREQQLQRYLLAILIIMNKQRNAETQEGDWQPVNATMTRAASLEESSEERYTLWQRVQGLLSREKVEPVEEAIPASAVEMPADPSEKKSETTPASDENVGQVGKLVQASHSSRPSAEHDGYSVAKEGAPALVVYCLGPLRVYHGDQLIEEWNGLKGQMVFKYLVTHRNKSVAKDVLMDLFWPDFDPEAARRNLHQAVYSLRQTLKDEQPDFQHILFDNDRYFLNPAMNVWVDCEEFVKRVENGRRLEAAGQIAEAMAEYGTAAGLYQGDFLEEDQYEEWTVREREQIRGMYLDATDRLSEHYVQQKEYTVALALCQKLLAHDGCHESAHRRLMRCYAAQNQRHLAIRQYQICRETLKGELDLEPSAETVSLYRQLTA